MTGDRSRPAPDARYPRTAPPVVAAACVAGLLLDAGTGAWVFLTVHALLAVLVLRNGAHLLVRGAVRGGTAAADGVGAGERSHLR